MNELVTERLIIKPYSPAEKSELIGLFTDSEVMKYVGDGVMTRLQAEEFWQKIFDKFYPRGIFMRAVFSRADSKYVGHTGIYPRPTKKEDWEFVYFLRRDAWGKGYATEIARKMIEHGFVELNLPEVFATVDNAHAASIRVLEKAGMNFLRYEYDAEGSYSVYSVKR